MSSASRSAADPLARLKRRTHLTWGAALPLLGLVALWALRPLEGVEVEAAGPVEGAGVVSKVETDGFDSAAFEARLWNPPEGKAGALAEKSAPTPDSAPIRLQLVGVIEEQGELTAALYDPDTDELRLVRDGMSIGQQRVTGITLTGVTLNDGRTTRELQIERGKP